PREERAPPLRERPPHHVRLAREAPPGARPACPATPPPRQRAPALPGRAPRRTSARRARRGLTGRPTRSSLAPAGARLPAAGRGSGDLGPPGSAALRWRAGLALHDRTDRFREAGEVAVEADAPLLLVRDRPDDDARGAQPRARLGGLDGVGRVHDR